MIQFYSLSGASVVLICVVFLINLFGTGRISYAYELSIVLSLIAVSLFVLSAFKRRRAPSFSKTAPEPAKTKEQNASAVRFSDVAANAHALKSLMELSDFLKNPDKYTRLGARIPRGVLLYGPPGTGKTLLARALAGEAGVPFIAMNGSDFVEMYVGVGASRVRDAFKKAKKHGKCVLFIDEIDSLGRSRSGTSSEERDQALNALLSEMSGFTPSDGVIVIAATNRWELLDPALLRPGRFDRHIEVGMPDCRERISILRLHAKNKPVSKDVDLESLALSTAFFSGASLENLLNEAALSAARRNAREIEAADVDYAYRLVTAGEDGQAHENASERAVIAVHEAGHALAACALFDLNPIRRISILPSSGGAAGYNLLIPEEKSLYTQKDMEKKILLLLAGRCAEEIVFSSEGITSGASGDIKRAFEIAVSMVNDFGFSDHPAIHEGAFSKFFGARTASGERVRSMLCGLYEETRSFLIQNKNTLIELSNLLLEKETLPKEAVDAFFSSHPLDLSNENRDSTKQVNF